MTRRSRISRTALLLVLGSSVLIAPVAWAQTALPQINRAGVKMSAQEAHDAARAGAIVLVDIRSPEEWRETGVPLGASPITMHQHPDTLLRELRKLHPKSSTKPLAVICAHGVRSSYLQDWLARHGFDRVIDVSEGMEGGHGGTGWLKAGLPVARWSKPEAQSGRSTP